MEVLEGIAIEAGKGIRLASQVLPYITSNDLRFHAWPTAVKRPRNTMISRGPWLSSRGHDGADFASKGCVKGVQAAPRARACTLVDLSTDATLSIAQFERAVGKAARGQFT